MDRHPHTPTTTVAGITIPTRRDNAVFVRTNYVKFSLQVNNGGSGRPQARATAVGAIYDLTPEADFAMREPLRQLELAVYAEEDGTVVATHRSFQFDGGADIDEDAVRERLLGETYALSERTQGSLGVTAFAYDEMPTDRDFRIDPATGKVQPVG